MKDAPTFLLLAEAADISRASISTVRWWIETGKLRAHRPGRRVLIERSALLAFLRGEPGPVEAAAPTTAHEAIAASWGDRQRKRALRRSGPR